MKNSFIRSHLTAATYGFIFAFFCGLVSVALLSFPFFVIFFAPVWGLIFYTIPTGLGIVLVLGLAKRLGPYDLFTLLAGVLALALSFGLQFATSIRSWLTSRGEIHGTLLGSGPPPEDIGGWIFRALSLAVWIGLMIVVGIAWKRSRDSHALSTALPPVEISKIYFWLGIDSLLVGVLTFAILSADLNRRREWSSPENVFARAASVLQDKDASTGDRALALNTIEQSRDDRSIDLLRRAVHEETGETQLAAAASLLGHDDLLALSVLEEPLMRGSQTTSAPLPTTSHTPSEGNGVKIAGFRQTINIGAYLRGVKDPAAVPILVHLMTSPDKETRRGAASALRNIMTLRQAGMDRWAPTWPDTIDMQEVTDAMIAGLSDSDEMVRYFSVCTLMEINLNPHYPSVFLFKHNEAEYVNGWKAWAKNRVPSR